MIQQSYFWVYAVVQLPSCVWLFATPWTVAYHAFLSLTISQSLPKFMSIALEMPSSHLILWCPLFLLSSIFPSIRDFSNELAVCIRWPKYWSFSFSISPSNKNSGLISLKIDVISFLSKRLSGVFSSTTVQRHRFFSAPPSLQSSSDNCAWPLGDHSLLDYMDLCQQSDVSAFQHTVRFVIAFLPRSKHLLISWLQSPSAVILEPEKRKSVTTSTFSPSICHEVMGPDAMILVFFNI